MKMNFSTEEESVALLHIFQVQDKKAIQQASFLANEDLLRSDDKNSSSHSNFANFFFTGGLNSILNFSNVPPSKTKTKHG